MNFYMTLKMSFKDILGNKLRTFLTMLGIIIGVSAVIIMVSLVEGATSNVTSSIESMGSNLLTVNIRSGYVNSTNALSYEDIKNLENYESVQYASPVLSGNVTSKYGTTSYDTSLQGIDTSYIYTRNYSVSSGRFIVPLDNEGRNNIALLGADVVEELFSDASPLGEEILLNGTKFKVVGILEESGSTMGGSNDDIIMVPIKTAQRFLQQSNITTIYIQAADADSVGVAEYQLEQYFLKVFKNEEDAFMIFNQSSLLETINEVTGTMAMMLGGIAAISLIVGGIGIMNIMLVSVTERTREIGIRKAIGAKRSSILKQFLIESAVVSGSGGIIGVIIGIGGSYIAGLFTGMPTATPIYIILIAFGFSLLVGIFFGIYPANQAAKLKPVDALRYE